MGLKDIHEAKHDGSFDPLTPEPDNDLPEPKKSKRGLAIAVVTLVILLAGGAAAYWFYMHKSVKSVTSSKQTAVPAASTEPAVPVITAKTKHYISTGFTLEFDYPEDWTVNEVTGNGKLTATSPSLNLKTVSGTTLKGQVILTMRDKKQPLTEFDKGNAVAVRESEKIAYTKPSSVQRGSTYLSFLSYASSLENGNIDGVFVTGDVGYKVGQAIPKADFVPIDPVVSLTFMKCGNTSCSGQGAQASGVAPSMWEDAQFGKPLKTMLQSLIVN